MWPAAEGKLDAGCRPALLSQLSNTSHTHAGWHLLSGKMAVLAAMLERLRPIGDRIVVVSNSTQVLDLIGALCRECKVSPLRRKGLTASTDWHHPITRLRRHEKWISWTMHKALTSAKAWCPVASFQHDTICMPAMAQHRQESQSAPVQESPK